MTSCPVCEEEHDGDMLLKCYHCGISLCEDCRSEHTVIVRDETEASLAALKTQLAQYDVTDLRATAVSKQEENIKALDGAVDGAVDKVIEVVKARSTMLKDEIQRRVENVRDRVLDEYVTHMQQKMVEVQQFCETPMKSMSAQKKIHQYQQQIRQNKRLIDDCEAQMVNVGDIKLDLVDDDVIKVLSDFGKILKASEVSENIDSQKPDGKKVDVRPKAVQRPLPPSLIDRKIEQVMRCIGRTGSEPGMFKGLSHVAVSPVSGNIIVCDDGNKRLQVFNETGDFIRVIPIEGFSPRGLKVSSDGTIYMLSWDGSTVRLNTLTEEGTHLGNFEIAQSFDFAIDNDQRIHVTSGTDGVYVYDKHGQLITRYGQVTGVEIDGKHIVINPHTGDIYIFTSRDNNNKYIQGYICNCVEYVVQVFNKDLQYVMSVWINQMLGEAGPGYSISSVSIVDNDMFLITWNNHYSSSWSSVLMLNQQLEREKDIVPETLLGKGVGNVYEPTGAAVTLTGHVAVVDGNDFLQLF